VAVSVIVLVFEVADDHAGIQQGVLVVAVEHSLLSRLLNDSM
jgi:hypothetical protein